ncbi:MAG: hypothetical protein Q9182_000949 [Xanthomendoza sp. 2 TL-2023]
MEFGLLHHIPDEEKDEPNDMQEHPAQGELFAEITEKNKMARRVKKSCIRRSMGEEMNLYRGVEA